MMTKTGKTAAALICAVFLCSGAVSAEDRIMDIGLGFFSGYYPERGTVVILASYKEWEFKTADIGPEELEGINPGSLVEFTFYAEPGGFTVTEITDYGLPTPKEYERIVADYNRKRKMIPEKE